jgi:hypothetical protein
MPADFIYKYISPPRSMAMNGPGDALMIGMTIKLPKPLRT